MQFQASFDERGSIPLTDTCRVFLGQRRGARRLESIRRVVAATVSEKFFTFFFSEKGACSSGDQARSGLGGSRCSAYVDHLGKLQLLSGEIHGNNRFLGTEDAEPTCDQNRRIAGGTP